MKTLAGWFRNRVRLLRFRFLKRFHRPGRRSWWAFNRTTVARGLAIGLFFGVLLPVAQIVFAISAAIALRANVLVAALSTLVTNPVTLPFVYLLAYRIGAILTESDAGLVDDVAASEAAAEQSFEVTHWPDALLEWISNIALPFIIGLALLATLAALAGFLLVHVAWSLWKVLRGPRSGRQSSPRSSDS